MLPCLFANSSTRYELLPFRSVFYKTDSCFLRRRSTRSSGVAVEQAPLVLPLPKRKKNSGRVGLRSGGRAPPAKELPKIKRPSSGRPSLAREKPKSVEESASESEESEDEKPLAKKAKPAPKVEKKLPVKKPVDQVVAFFILASDFSH
jgi:hypothetical protein